MAAAYEEDADGAPAAAGATLSETAFRQAEKRYQLHYEQQLRRRKGRLVGGTLVAQPTDLSDIIDVRSTKGSADIAVCTLQQPGQACRCSCQPRQASAEDLSSSSITALVFRKQPGLVVFPAAVPAPLQLQLFQTALQEWPDPPARTNHTKVYGMTLCQLFQAVQQDLCLDISAQPQQQQKGSQQQHQQQQQDGSQPEEQQPNGIQQQQDGSQQEQQVQAARQDVTPNAGTQPQLQQGRSQQAAQLSQPPQQQLQQHQRQGQNHQQQCGTPQQHQQHECCRFCHPLQHPHKADSSSSSSTWSPCGTGPKASLLLRKLRWVCLGPPYNWTDRVYEPHLPHRPLPPSLVHLAQQYAELAQQAQDQAAAAAGGGAGGVHSNGSGIPAAAAAPQQQHAAAVVSSSVAGVDCQGSRPYVPDAALVNYYHGGDTLNGHKDDVERDLSQPIVTLSLGCDAIFLVGGLTREVEPTALLLRSGDIVVMGQEARACYHGVPRVLTDNPLAADVLQAAEQAGDVYQPYLQHMQGSRVNISIRSTQ